MTALLTLNGIPPQGLPPLTPQQQAAIIAHPWPEGRSDFTIDADTLPAPMNPFARRGLATAEAFTAWGAQKIEGLFSFISKDIAPGETTFTRDDLHPHSDVKFGLKLLQEENILTLRMLCVSSFPASFVDLTGDKEREAILALHRTAENPRLYKDSLMEWAKQNQRIFTAQIWQPHIFDGMTPHQPRLATEAHKRLFMQAWIELALPQDWQDRVRQGDVPRLKPRQILNNLAF